MFLYMQQNRAFVDYKYQKGKVESANDGDLHVKGICSVKLKIYDRIEVKLMGVKNAPKLRRI